MSRLTREGTAEPVSRDQILRRERGQGNIHFRCSADHEQDWQPYPVDPYTYCNVAILPVVTKDLPISPRSSPTIFYRDASSALLHLANHRWLKFIYSRSHGFRYETRMCVCVCVFVRFLPIYSGRQVRWMYQPRSHRRKVTQDFSSTLSAISRVGDFCVLKFYLCIYRHGSSLSVYSTLRRPWQHILRQ